MKHPLLTTLLIVALPLAGLLGGGRLLFVLAGRQPLPRGERPLFTRLAGYSVSDVAAYWSKLGPADHGLLAERRFLELDLVFPFVYGGTLCASLLLLWALLGRPFPAVLPVGLVALTMLADWTENLIQLRQLGRFVAGSSLEADWIRWASLATSVKLVGTGCGLVALLVLALVYRFRR